MTSSGSTTTTTTTTTRTTRVSDVDKEIYELEAIVVTLDKILATLGRLTKLVDLPNGELFQAQKQFELALSTSKLELVDATNSAKGASGQPVPLGGKRRGRPPKGSRVDNKTKKRKKGGDDDEEDFEDDAEDEDYV